jgi:hypothetical protein
LTKSLTLYDTNYFIWVDLSNLPDSPLQPQTPTPITNAADTAAALEYLVQIAAPTPTPEVINLLDIEPGVAQLLANHFNVPPAKSKDDGNTKLQQVPLPCGNIVWGVPGLYDFKSYTKIPEWESYEKMARQLPSISKARSMLEHRWARNFLHRPLFTCQICQAAVLKI